MATQLNLWILEAAFRSLLMAFAVWGGMRLLRVHHVLAQKTAWVLVLLSAAVMPVVMRVPLLPQNHAFEIPAQRFVEARQASARVLAQIEPFAYRIAAQFLPSQFIPAQFIPAQFIPAQFIPDGNVVEDQIRRAGSETVRASSGSSTLTLRSRGEHHNQEQSRHVQATRHGGVQVARTGKRDPAEPVSTQVLLVQSPHAAVPVSQVSTRSSWSLLANLLTFAYFAIAACFLLRTSLGLLLALRLWKRSESISLTEETSSGSSFLFASPNLRIRVSPDLTTPVTIGSSVLLPYDYEQWEEDKLRIVLAHEQSHVHQKDFYLQLFAGLHKAFFWFSPLGWWLERKISELGEALSDRAGLQQAASPASYAALLLEFAAQPRTHTFSFAGVPMARSSNLSSRVERILNESRFRLAYLGGRRHALLAAALVPTALLSTVAFIRIVPAVRAAEVQTRAAASVQKPDQASTLLVSAQLPTEPVISTPAATTLLAQAAPPAAPSAPSEIAPPAEMPPSPSGQLSPAPDVAPPAPMAPPQVREDAEDSDRDDHGDRNGSFAIVHEDAKGKSDKTVVMNGADQDFDKIRRDHHGNYIWFERDGKSYLITDPSILEQARLMFKGNDELNRKQAELNARQDLLNKEMDKFKPEKELALAQLDSPEFREQMKKLNAELAQLSEVRLKDLNEKISQETLSHLQERIGDIQGRIGEIQGKIGEQEGLIGEKQGEIGERMGKLGEQMGKIGEEQGRIAEEAAHKLQSVFDQAIKDGKAKPVE